MDGRGLERALALGFEIELETERLWFARARDLFSAKTPGWARAESCEGENEALGLHRTRLLGAAGMRMHSVFSGDDMAGRCQLDKTMVERRNRRGGAGESEKTIAGSVVIADSFFFVLFFLQGLRV